MEAEAQLIDGTGTAVLATTAVRLEEEESNPWLDGIVASRGSSRDSISPQFVREWFADIQKSVSLGLMPLPPVPSESVLGRATEHEAALSVLDSALSGSQEEDEETWRAVRTGLEQERESARKLFE